jgi:predicted alpha/beta hydrolase
MNTVELEVPALDGLPLAATLHRPALPPRGVVVINSAMGVSRRFYARFAAHLAGRGYCVVSYDYRGIGGSALASGARLRHWGELDFAGVLAWARSAFPDVPLACVGHSLGGQILGLTREARHVRAFLAVAAQSGYWRHWNRQYWPKLLAAWYVAAPAAAAALGRVPGFLIGGEALPSGIARDWARWCRTPHYMSDEDGRPLRPFFDEIACPALFLAIRDDGAFAPEPAVRALASWYQRAAIEFAVVDPREWGVASLGHFGFFRKDAPAELWRWCADWLDRGLADAGACSPADRSCR